MTLFKPSEVANTLRIDLSSVYRLIKEGKLGCYKIGCSVRISQDDLDEYLSSRRMKAINLVKPKHYNTMKKALLIITLLAATFLSSNAQDKPRTFVNLPSYAQVNLLDQRASEFHTAGDVLSITGAVIALSSLQAHTVNSDMKARIFAGAAMVGVGRLVHLFGSHAQKRANRIRFTQSGLSFNF